MLCEEDYSFTSLEWNNSSESGLDEDFIQEFLESFSEPQSKEENDQPKSSSGKSNSTIVKKSTSRCTRRPSVKPEFMPDIRVLKHDIRGRYGEMYANVTNSQDPKLVQDFFFQFCLPSCYYDNKFAEGCKFGEFIGSLFSPGPETRSREAGLAGQNSMISNDQLKSFRN